MRKLTLGSMLVVLTTGQAYKNDSVLLSSRGPASTHPLPYRASLVTRGKILSSQKTISYALDRIDQEGFPLDGLYSHYGTGRGVTVYVFDGGVSRTHTELAGRVRVGHSAFPDDPLLCNAHGTAVAGAIAGKTLGVAPEAEIVDVKMIRCHVPEKDSLRGSVQAIVEDARWVLEDHVAHPGPAVANWSFIVDSLQRNETTDSVVKKLEEAGITVVVASGNVDRNACNMSPANAPGVITVSSIKLASSIGADGKIHYFDVRAPQSGFGSCVSLYAPGDSVMLPSFGPNGEPQTQHWNGTSFATGFVSGAAALYLEAHPRARPWEVREALRQSATRTSAERIPEVDQRILNVSKLLKPNP